MQHIDDDLTTMDDDAEALFIFLWIVFVMIMGGVLWGFLTHLI